MAVQLRVLCPILSLCLLVACGPTDARRMAQRDAPSQLASVLPDSDRDRGQEGPFDFSWRLSGDRLAAPLQVFSSAAGVWLQFPAADTHPAIFGEADDGRQTLLAAALRTPYLFVPGGWRRLVFRAGARLAYAANVQETTATSPWQVRAENAASPGQVLLGYRVTRADGNFRRVLRRWAQSAQWTFEPEHWTLDADIPVSAEADLGTDFRSAVRQLMASTELGDLPAQACFYTNRVLRVVAYAQQCDPRTGDQSLRLQSVMQGASQ